MTLISEINELDINATRKREVKKYMYKAVGSTDSQTVLFTKTLLKLNFAPGSTASMRFLEALNAIPAENDIHSSKVIDQILKYKFARVKGVAIFHFVLYCCYLFCLVVYAAENKAWLMPWPFIQTIFEIIQVQASIKTHRSYLKGLSRYYVSGGGENLKDLLRITLMCIYIWSNLWRAEIFSLLCLISVLGLMSYMRFVHSLAVFIELY